MAKTNTFHCSVITPERVVLDCEAVAAVLPAHDGELGVLVNRAPLVCKLGTGGLRINAAGVQHVMFIDGGFAQMVDNKLSVLTEQARYVDQLHRKDAEAALVEARTLPATDDAAFEKRQRAVKRAKTQLRLARTE